MYGLTVDMPLLAGTDQGPAVTFSQPLSGTLRAAERFGEETLAYVLPAKVSGHVFEGLILR